MKASKTLIIKESDSDKVSSPKVVLDGKSVDIYDSSNKRRKGTCSSSEKDEKTNTIKKFNKFPSQRERLSVTERSSYRSSKRLKSQPSINKHVKEDSLLNRLKSFVVSDNQSSKPLSNTFQDSLYYLTPLFEEFKEAIGSSSPLQNPTKKSLGSEKKTTSPIKALEHYSQNILSFQKVKKWAESHSEDYLSKKVEIPSPQNPKQLTIIFDLDETLIRCRDDLEKSEPHKSNKTDNSGGSKASEKDCKDSEVEDKASDLSLLLLLRPHCLEVLASLSKHFELGLFTSAPKSYAQPILDRLDPSQILFNFTLFAEDCVTLENNNSQLLVKDLRILQDRDLKKVFLVDNNLYCSVLQPNNHIPIYPFGGLKCDQELLLLEKYLLKLAKTSCPVDFNRQYFGLDLLEASSQGSMQNFPALMLKRVKQQIDQQRK